jgi:hypothetical protein
VKPLLTTGQRDRSRAVLVVLSGTLAASAVAATGGATALAARETTRAEAEKARVQAAAEAEAARLHHEELLAWAKAHPVVVTTPKPQRTVVGPKVVVRASAPGTARVGGTVWGSTGPAAPATGGAPAPAAPPAVSAPAPPPPPPPPPVTSTGS